MRRFFHWEGTKARVVASWESTVRLKLFWEEAKEGCGYILSDNRSLKSMYSCLTILERNFSGNGGKVRLFSAPRCNREAEPWGADGRLGTSWCCEWPPSCITCGRLFVICPMVLLRTLLRPLAEERGGTSVCKPRAWSESVCWGPMTSAMISRSWLSWSCENCEPEERCWRSGEESRWSTSVNISGFMFDVVGAGRRGPTTCVWWPFACSCS